MADLSGLNPEQREAASTLDGPVLILAGAGTGKTRTITHRVAHMMDSGVAPENILAVTFTNKAAREMQQRAAKLTPKAPKGDEGKPRKPTICTFHSLCVRILRRHIEKLGYKRNFVIYNEAEQLGVVKKILSAISGKDVKAEPREVHSLLSRIKNAGIDSSVVDSDEAAAGGNGLHPRDRRQARK